MNITILGDGGWGSAVSCTLCNNRHNVTLWGPFKENIDYMAQHRVNQKFLPGTHIPIFPPDKIQETKPDYVFILPWNLKDEIMEQVSYIREWGGQFVVPIPEATVYP
jgi:glycerol-3-phosphate dehydrogenase